MTQHKYNMITKISPKKRKNEPLLINVLCNPLLEFLISKHIFLIYSEITEKLTV